MHKVDQHSARVVILDSAPAKYKRFVRGHVSVCRTAADIEKVYEENPANLTWISCTTELTDRLVKIVARRRGLEHISGVRKGESVLTVQSPRPESLPTLHGLFARIVGDSPRYHWLSSEELIEVLVTTGIDRSALLIAVAADPITETVTIVRGDLQVVVVPFSCFEPSGDGMKPDFSRISVTDYGRIVSFGDYEASADAILYEADPVYRRKTHRTRRETERTFGASLFRLRKQRKLSRGDFSPLNAKTIARIERNEIGTPHGKTLQILSERLGVKPDEIKSY